MGRSLRYWTHAASIGCADGDAPGQMAAQGLAERAYALGWHVEMLNAPGGMDWNDVLLRDTRHPQ